MYNVLHHCRPECPPPVKNPAKKPVKTPPHEGVRPAAEALAVLAIMAGVIGGPLALGGAPAWATAGLQLTSVASGVLWVWSARRPLWLMLLPLVLAGLFAIQLMPMPDRLLTAIAPVSAGLWKVAHEGMPDAWGRVSVVPWETLAGLRQLVFTITTLVVVADLGRVERYRRWFLAAVACAGVMIATLGAVFPRDPGGPDRPRVVMGFYDLRGPFDYWKTSVKRPVETAAFSRSDWVVAGDVRYLAESWVVGDPVGPYIDSNKFAGGMCLTVPVAVAAGLALAAAWRIPAAAAVLAALVVMPGGLWMVGAMAGSRAGAAAWVLAGLVLAALAAPRGIFRRAFQGLAIAYGAAMTVFLGIFLGPLRWVVDLLPAAVQGPLANLLANDRIAAAVSAGRMFAASPVLGTGLGSYGHLQPYLLKTREPLFYAHNDVVQLLAETGMAGVVVALACAVWLGRALLGWSRAELRPGASRDLPPHQRLADAGVWAAWAGIALYSFFDWNLHLPGNAFLATVVTGLCLSSGDGDGNPSAPRTRRFGAAGLLVSGLLSGMLLSAAAWALRDVASARVERQLRDALVSVRLAARQRPPAAFPQEEVMAAVSAGAEMRAADRANASLPLLLGQLSLQLAAHGEEAAGPAAADWFRQALRLCPPCSGFPEAVPPPKKAKPRPPRAKAP